MGAEGLSFPTSMLDIFIKPQFYFLNKKLLKDDTSSSIDLNIFKRLLNSHIFLFECRIVDCRLFAFALYNILYFCLFV